FLSENFPVHGGDHHIVSAAYCLKGIHLGEDRLQGLEMGIMKLITGGTPEIGGNDTVGSQAVFHDRKKFLSGEMKGDGVAVECVENDEIVFFPCAPEEHPAVLDMDMLLISGAEREIFL